MVQASRITSGRTGAGGATSPLQAGPESSAALVQVLEALINQLRSDLRRDLLAELEQSVQTPAWPEWMSIETAARYLDMPVERIRKLVARRAVPFSQEGRGCRVFFSRTALDEWMRLWSQ